MKKITQNLWISVVLAILSIAVVAEVKASVDSAKPKSGENSSRPNFVIVLGDDISWDTFGCMNPTGYTRTPNIDKLANEGLRLANFRCATALCVPVRHELYTALLPPSSGVYGNTTKPKDSFKNVNNFLGDLGYEVGRTGKNHFKTTHNFKKVDGFDGNCNSSKPGWNIDGSKKFVQDAISKKKNFCLFICSVHAHHPWTMGDPSHFPVDKVTLPPHMVDTPKTREVISRHAAEVEDFDNQVGATMSMLKELNLEKNTVLIVLSEQGTAMPRGKFMIYDYGNRALGVLRWPGVIAAGSTSPAITQYCDIVPTMVELAGGKQPEGVDGRSFGRVLKGETNEHKKYAYLCYGASRAIAGDRFKLVWNPGAKEYTGMYLRKKKGKMYSEAVAEWLEAAKTDPAAKRLVDLAFKRTEYELYDTQKDPYEMVNVAGDPKHADTLKTMIADLKAEMVLLKDTKIQDADDDDEDEDADADAKPKKKKKNSGTTEKDT